MENQENQNIQPDYDFILNQPGSPSAPKTPLPTSSRSHKKLIIVAVCAVVLLLGLAVAAVVASKSSSNQAATSSNDVSQVVNPVDQFMTALRQKDYAKAASYLPGDAQAQAISVKNLQTTFEAMNLGSCKVTKLTGNTIASYSDLTCRQNQDKYGIDMHFQISFDGGKPLILTYSVKAVL